MLKIKEIRKAKKVTQEQLASAAGIDRSCLVSYERGTMSPTVTTLEKIARALEVETAELLS